MVCGSWFRPLVRGIPKGGLYKRGVGNRERLNKSKSKPDQTLDTTDPKKGKPLLDMLPIVNTRLVLARSDESRKNKPRLTRYFGFSSSFRVRRRKTDLSNGTNVSLSTSLCTFILARCLVVTL